MKKLLLGLGTLGAMVVPMATIVACGTKKATLDEKIKQKYIDKINSLKDISSDQRSNAISKVGWAQTEDEANDAYIEAMTWQTQATLKSLGLA